MFLVVAKKSRSFFQFPVFN